MIENGQNRVIEEMFYNFLLSFAIRQENLVREAVNKAEVRRRQGKPCLNWD